MNRYDWQTMRLSKRITLEELAKHIGCSISLLSKYENYERNMTDEKVRLYQQYIKNKKT